MSKLLTAIAMASLTLSLACVAPDEDLDNDGVTDIEDNCPAIANSNQQDIDADELGDVCDPNMDNDLVLNDNDNCPAISNSEQLDSDGNGIGDACQTLDYAALAQALVENSNTWNALQLNDYQFTYHRSCFCEPELNGPLSVELVARLVTSAFNTDTGLYLAPERLAEVETINSLFTHIDNAITAEYVAIEASYDSSHGYPTYLFLDYATEIADDTVAYSVSNLIVTHP